MKLLKMNRFWVGLCMPVYYIIPQSKRHWPIALLQSSPLAKCPNRSCVKFVMKPTERMKPLPWQHAQISLLFMNVTRPAIVSCNLYCISKGFKQCRPIALPTGCGNRGALIWHKCFKCVFRKCSALIFILGPKWVRGS